MSGATPTTQEPESFAPRPPDDFDDHFTDHEFATPHHPPSRSDRGLLRHGKCRLSPTLFLFILLHFTPQINLHFHSPLHTSPPPPLLTMQHTTHTQASCISHFFICNISREMLHSNAIELPKLLSKIIALRVSSSSTASPASTGTSQTLECTLLTRHSISEWFLSPFDWFVRFFPFVFLLFFPSRLILP